MSTLKKVSHAKTECLDEANKIKGIISSDEANLPCIVKLFT